MKLQSTSKCKTNVDSFLSFFQHSTFTYIRSVFSFDYISAPEGPKTKKDNVKPMFFSTRGPENPKRQCKTNVFQHPRTQKTKKTFWFLARRGLRNIGSALSFWVLGPSGGEKCGFCIAFFVFWPVCPLPSY